MSADKKRASSVQQNMMIFAKRRIRSGFSILPLTRGERSRARSGKTPLSPHGVKDATNDVAAFRSLVAGHTTYNLGVATGTPSGVIVIDIDPRNGGDEEFAKLLGQLGPLPKTLTCKTGGGGMHFYYKSPPGGLKKQTLAPGVDLLGEGAYAVSPPSLHASGKQYLWAQGLGPRNKAAVPLPQAWLDFIESRSRASQKKPEDFAGDGITKGSRNTELTRTAGKMRRAGLSGEELLLALKGVNASRCQPPLEDDEVERIARNIGKYAVGGRHVDEAQEIATALLNADFDGGKWLRRELDGQFWSWNSTHWAVLPDMVLQRKILAFVKDADSSKSTKALVQEVFGLLQIQQALDDDQLHFASEPPNVVNVTNGELWLLNNGQIELRPHDPASGMRHFLKVTYNSEATCVEYDTALKATFQNAAKPQTLINFFNELMGYAIQMRRDIPLIVLMIGSGSNGKSSLIRILVELVGKDFVYSGRVDELEKSRFAIGSLVGKHVFIDDDVGAGAKLPDGSLKKISEAKLLTGEHKFKSQFSFVNRAFPILLCNNLPSLADLSHGMMRRIHVLPFKRTFKEHEIDREIVNRIIERELSGVLNRALEGWTHLKKRGHFPPSVDMRQARDTLLAHANPLKGFIDERCKTDPKHNVTLQRFYDAYREWAKASGYSMAQVKSTVKKNLEHQGYMVKRRAEGLMVIGLKVKDEL